MSQNPARELKSLLEGWKGPNNASVYSTRGAQNAANSALWDDMLRAVRLLDEVRAGLNTVDLLFVNRKMLDSIAATIFVPDAAWATQSSSKRPTHEQLGSLASWALILDRAEPQFTLEQADIDAAHEALSEARTVLQSVPGIPEAHRDYIAELIDAAVALLEGDRPDLPAARAKYHQAVGAVMFEPAVRTSDEGQTLVSRFSRVGAIFYFALAGIPVLQGIGTEVGSELILDYLRAPAAIEQSADEQGAEQESADEPATPDAD